MSLPNGNVAIRKLEKTDLPRLAEYANNKKIWNNLRNIMPHPYTAVDAELYYHMISKHQTQQNFAIDFDGYFTGMIGIHPQADVYRKSAEIGYWIAEPYWGKGIATKAVKLIVDYGFQNLDIIRIYAGVFSFNPSSMRVLEKVGFQKEGILKKSIYKNGAFADEVRYALINQ